MRALLLLLALGLGAFFLATCQLPEFEGTRGPRDANARAESPGPTGPSKPRNTGSSPGPAGPDQPVANPVRTGPVVQLGHATPDTFPGPVHKDATRGTEGYWGIRLKEVDQRSDQGHILGKGKAADEDLILIFRASGDAKIGTSERDGADIILFDHKVTSATVRGASDDPLEVHDGKFRITIPAGQAGWALHSKFPSSGNANRGIKRFRLELIRVVGKDSGADYPVGWNAKGEFVIN
mgnify:CR=1 FL=1|tara:strand:- start:199 stop:909 length:711 start_codon:yes stop_codon:yes gene_type:complete